MKRAVPLILAIASAFVLFAVPSAGAVSIPTLTSLTSSVTQDPENGRHLTVHYEYEQTGVNVGGTWTNIFAVKAWNSDCSGGWPASVQWETNELLYLSPATGSGDVELTLGLYPYMPLCVGVRAMAANEMMSVTHMDFAKMTWELQEGETYTDSVTVPLKVTPNGLPTSYHLAYFKHPGSGSCIEHENEIEAQDTDTETITDDLYAEHTVYPQVGGLDPETQYCIAVRIGNSMGADTEHFWAYSTESPPPTLNSERYWGGDGMINFEVSVTPNATASDTSLSFNYFKKTDNDCTLPPLDEIGVYTFPSLSPARGSSAAQAVSSIPGLDAQEYYCVRGFAINGGGGTTPGDWTIVRTVNQQPITVSYRYLQASTDEYHDVDFIFGLDDMGAYADLGVAVETSLDQFRVAASACNAEGIVGETPFYSTEPYNAGTGPEPEYAVGLAAGARGTANCIHVHAESGWGSPFDVDFFVAFKSGAKPSFTNEETAKTAHSVTLTADLDIGEFDSGVTIFHSKLADGESCGDGTPDSEALPPVEATVSSNHSVSKTLTGLDDFTRYCVWFLASNAMGQGGTNWQEVRTLDATAPSKPANLAATDVSTSGGTLTWGDSSDNDQVDEYRIYKDGLLLGTTDNVLSKRVDLACGQTAHLRVSAVDPAGNESTASDEFALTAAACPLPPSPETKTCLAPLKTKTVSLKNKKKSVRATVKSVVGADRQNMTITAKAAGATITFKVDGKKVAGKKGSITISNNPSLVTVSFKLAGKTKTVKLTIGKYAC